MQVRESESVAVLERARHRSATEDLQRLQAELEAARETWDRERGTLNTVIQVGVSTVPFGHSYLWSLFRRRQQRSQL